MSDGPLLIYIDTSLLVPYYCPEQLSGAAERALRGDPSPALSDLVEVEFFSALATKVRTREMSAADAALTNERFLGHLREGLYVRIPVQRRHYEIARGWLAHSRCRCAHWTFCIWLWPSWSGCTWRPATAICRDRRKRSASPSP